MVSGFEFTGNTYSRIWDYDFLIDINERPTISGNTFDSSMPHLTLTGYLTERAVTIAAYQGLPYHWWTGGVSNGMTLTQPSGVSLLIEYVSVDLGGAWQVEPGASIGESVHLGAYAVVHAGAVVGAGCVLSDHVVVEGDVVIGDDCVFEPGAIVHNGARLGNRVHLGAYSVVSRQGFGFAPGPQGPIQLHHVGLTVLEDGVRIGAGTTVDRARFDETRIGAMSALDNQIHIGHNATVGQRTFIAAQTGMAGNSHIGDDCQIGGQVGLANHARIGNRCGIGAQSGAMGTWEEGTTLFGSPAFEKTEFFRMLSALRKLSKRKSSKR